MEPKQEISLVAKVFNLLFMASMLFFLMWVKPKVFAGMVVVLFLFYLFKILRNR